MKYANIYSNVQEGTFDSELRKYMYLIYKNMGFALLISGIVALLVSSIPSLFYLIHGNLIISLIVQLSPLFFIFSINKTLMNGTVEQARTKLFIFSSLMGLSLSSIFLMYTKQDIFQTFLTTSITFGCMSFYGYSTKNDLTKLSSFLFMGICGLFVASLINLFLKSGQMSFILSCVGVVIFTLYTAYDVQKLKNLYNYIGIGSDAKEKIAIFGALELYLDFINLFLNLLRILNNVRKE